MSNFMGVGIFWIGLNWADLGCWRLTLNGNWVVLFYPNHIAIAKRKLFLNGLLSRPTDV